MSSSLLRLGPGDLIDIEVFDVPELKQTIRVNEAGDAELLGVGQMTFSALTIPQAQEAIAAQLKQKLLVPHAQVTLTIKEFGTQGVAISGEIRKPGMYPMFAPRTLLQLITEAGGLTDMAMPVMTVRRGTGASVTTSFKSAPEFQVLPGDTVVIPRMGIAYIVGEVARSGGYVMQDEGRLSIAQLVSLGGGLRRTARGSRAKLVRGSGEDRRELSIDVDKILRGRSQDVELEANDILFIPDSVWKISAARLQNITQMAAGAAIYTGLN